MQDAAGNDAPGFTGQAVARAGRGTTKLVFSYETIANDVDVDSVAIGGTS